MCVCACTCLGWVGVVCLHMHTYVCWGGVDFGVTGLAHSGHYFTFCSDRLKNDELLAAKKEEESKVAREKMREEQRRRREAVSKE